MGSRLNRPGCDSPKVLTKGARGWQVLLYHRDIQPYTDDGRYPRALTVVPPTPEEGVTSRHHFP